MFYLLLKIESLKICETFLYEENSAKGYQILQDNKIGFIPFFSIDQYFNSKKYLVAKINQEIFEEIKDNPNLQSKNFIEVLCKLGLEEFII
jgi:hypothetical protein